VVRPDLNMVFRRIKHFSGYIIMSSTDEGSSSTSPAY
jgi:hypothetical protein